MTRCECITFAYLAISKVEMLVFWQNASFFDGKMPESAEKCQQYRNCGYRKNARDKQDKKRNTGKMQTNEEESI